jgi:hypothetical protein
LSFGFMVWFSKWVVLNITPGKESEIETETFLWKPTCLYVLMFLQSDFICCLRYYKCGYFVSPLAWLGSTCSLTNSTYKMHKWPCMEPRLDVTQMGAQHHLLQ